MSQIINNIYEKFGIEGIYSTYIEQVTGIHYDTNEGIQIIYIIDGEISVLNGDKSSIYKKGELILLNRNEIKFLYTNNVNSYILVLNIKDNYLEKISDIYCSSIFQRELNHLYNTSDLRNLIIHIHILSFNKKDEGIRMKNLNEILDILVKDYIDNENNIKGNEDRIIYIKEIKNYVNNTDLTKVSLDLISEDMFISTSYISTLFSEFSNMTFSEYLQQYRLYIASKYLLKTNANIEEVAVKVGFKSTKSLNNLFKKYLSITPSAYRSKYKNRDESKYNDYKKIYSNLDSLDNSGYKDMYDVREMNTHRLSLQSHKIDNVDNWRFIRSLNTFGQDYLLKVRKILEEFNINEIFLNFYLIDGEIRIENKNRNITKRQLYDLMNLLIEFDVVPTLNVYLEENNWTKVSLSKMKHMMDENLLLIDEFYQEILDIVGLTNMKRFKYTINIRNINSYYQDKDKINLYREYIIKQQRMIRDKLDITDYIWGYELGDIDEEKIMNLRNLYQTFETEVFVPSYVSLSYALSKDQNIKSINDSIKLTNEVQYAIDNLGNHLDEFSEKFTNIYVRDLFKFIDLTAIPEDYKDLFAVLLINETIFFTESKYNYKFEYKMMDKSRPDGLYYPKLENQYGFKTTIYWIYHLIDQMKGEFIYRKRNVIVSREDNDIYILAFGSSIIDYLFSKKHNFIDLYNFTNEIDITIDGINGKYKVTEEILSYENGSVEHYLVDYNNFKYLSENEIDYVQKISAPKFTLEIKEYENKLEERIIHSPFNIILKKYIKIS